ncbi:MAG: DUF4214 domain-containing protein [Clostridiales bacterium]|nr:DUF4214 domain-containing protein [Clostridiales bacterium]
MNKKRSCIGYLCLILTTLLLLGLYSADVCASTYSCTVTGYYDQEEARRIYPLLEQWRHDPDEAWYWLRNEDDSEESSGFLSLPNLTYSYNLEQIAMQRAAEYILANSHNRPDGSKFSTLTYNGSVAKGECLLRMVHSDTFTVQDVFDAWKETDAPFAGQGHRRIMLGTYTYVGSSKFTYDGFDYWVLEFGYSSTCSTGTSTTAFVGNMTRTLDIDTDKINLEATAYPDITSEVLFLGNDPYDLPDVSVRIKVRNQSTTAGVKLSSDLYDITWYSEDESVVRIENGKLVPVKEGNADVVASIVFDGDITASAEINITVDKLSLTNASISDIEDKIYTGGEIHPEPAVTLNGKLLTKGVDYDLFYTGCIDAGEDNNVYISGKGNYKGQTVTGFNILPRDISEVQIEDIEDLVFNDGYQLPFLSLTYNGRELTTGDYSRSGSPQKNAGTYQIILTGKGNFTGSTEVSYKILPQSIAGWTTDEIKDKEYTGNAITPNFCVYGNGSIIEPENYTVSYSDNTEPGTAVITITGIGNYEGTIEKTFVIRKRDIKTLVFEYEDELVYDGGNELEPDITVSMNGVSLVREEDFEVSYSNNVNAGTGKITVTGTGRFTGSETFDFTIEEKDIGELSMDPVGARIYTGQEITPDIVIKDREKTLTQGEDYEVSFEDNTDTGTAVIDITGIGNYKGSITGSFVIGAKDIGGMELPIIEDIVFENRQIKPEFEVTVDSLVLLEYVDYELSYGENLNAGEGTVTITGKGNYEGVKEISFLILSRSIDISEAAVGESFEYTGAQIKPDVTVVCDGTELINGTDFEVSYGTNINAGSGTVVITGTGNYASEITLEFEITPKDIEGSGISEIPSEIFTGDNIEPEFTVTSDGIELIRGTDYEVSFEDNVNPGTARVLIEGKGNYKGSIETTFIINAKDLSVLTVEPIKAQRFIEGEECCPEVVIRNGDYVLVKDVDFEITYEGNDQIGDATARITGINDYTGELTLYFRIAKETVYDLTIDEIDPVTYTGEVFEPSVTVRDGEDILTEGTDYTVSYDNDPDVGTHTVTVAGKGDYAGEICATFDILPKDIGRIDVTGIADSKTYTGSELTIEPQILFNGTELTEGKDYKISYADNINAGTASYSIYGTGNFSGNIDGTFVIDPKSADELDIEDIAPQIYTGNVLTPEVSVKDNGRELKAGEDYILTYDDPVGSGTYEVTLEGTGNYEGERVLLFEVTPRDIDGLDIEDIADKTYTGYPISPVPVLSYGGAALSSSDYVISYSSNLEKGEASILIEGKGNFCGSTTVTFNIVAFDIGSLEIKGLSEKTYTGSEIMPQVKVQYGDIILEKDRDYFVTYENNVNVGPAEVTVTGMGNFEGILEGTFMINARSIEDMTVDPVSDMIYTGSEIIPPVVLRWEDVELVFDTDYKVYTVNSIDTGSYDLTVEGCGNFCGVLHTTFNIVAKDGTPLKIDELPQATYKGSPITPSVVIRDKDKILTDRDYDLTYENNVNAGEGKIKVSFKGNYTGESEVSFVILPKDVSGLTIDDIEDIVYTGSSIVPSVTVRDGETVVSPDDYDIFFSNHTNAGEAGIRIEGKNNYKGTVSLSFRIDPKDMSDFSIKGAEEEMTYTGKEITFDFVVTGDNTELIKDQDFKVEYSSNINAGTATYKITGINNYKGTVEGSFVIVPKDISLADIAKISDKAFTGGYICPDVYVTDEGTVLKEDEDYKVSFSDNKKVGSDASVTVTGKGNYEGSKTVTFKIVKAKIKDLSISQISDKDYTGSEISPKPKVKNGSITLTEGTDYSLTYKNNTDPGQATVTITGMGNYEGKKDITFKIKDIPVTPPPPTPVVTVTPEPEPETPDNKEGIRGFVERLYDYVLGRPSEPGGIDYWTDELYCFRQTGAQVAIGFIDSPEFKGRNKTESEFVDILYRTFFGREPDDEGKKFWMSQLSSGVMTRHEVAMGFIDSQEWADTCASYGIRSGGSYSPKVNIAPSDLTYGFVERMYLTALGRGFDQSGRDHWANALANFKLTGEAVGVSFFLSDEMKGYDLSDEEFLERLYLTFMDRPSDPDGKKYWLNCMKNNMTREQVVLGFTRSPEFVEKCIEARILPY